MASHLGTTHYLPADPRFGARKRSHDVPMIICEFCGSGVDVEYRAVPWLDQIPHFLCGEHDPAAGWRDESFTDLA